MLFVDAMQNELNNKKKSTENGALGYQTTGKKLLDLNFSVASLRKKSEQEIINKFMDAYYENPRLAIKWLFYVSDVREGVGERRTFRVIMRYLSENQQLAALSVLKLIPEYSRWDNLIDLLNCNNAYVSNEVLKLIKNQLYIDMENMVNNKPISLLGKWLPSINTSSENSRNLAKIIANYLHYTDKRYRKTLSRIRKYLDVVECKMSANQWGEINYSTVPSKANIKYSNAFLRNDNQRRNEYLENLKNGKAKINTGVLFPHDVVHKYSTPSCYNLVLKPYDEALEQMWKSLKNIGTINDTIVVADGSGSMFCTVDNHSSVTALDVANSIAIYCSERCRGEFKDKYITFSSMPQLVDMKNAKSLHDKLEIAKRHNECSNTNIEAVFDLILDTATKNNIPQTEIPKNILIISDMEFDIATCSYAYYNRPNETLFENISRKYEECGYVLPKLVFWNVNSRTGTIPIKQNKMGVSLVSGFSVNILKLVLNGELDPYKALVKELNSERYNMVDDALESIYKNYFYNH